MKTLVTPPAALRDADSIQMLSAWVAENGLHCAINIGMWQANGQDESRAWGILLADVIRHIANASAQELGKNPEETVEAVFESLERELQAPTSSVTGAFHVGHS